MSPDEMSERLAAWEAHCEECRGLGLPPCGDGWRRVVCVEPEGPRRTWVLHEGGRQVGHVRMRATPVAHRVGVNSALSCGPVRTEIVSVDMWTWEASDRTREMLGLEALDG